MRAPVPRRVYSLLVVLGLALTWLLVPQLSHFSPAAAQSATGTGSSACLTSPATVLPTAMPTATPAGTVPANISSVGTVSAVPAATPAFPIIVCPTLPAGAATTPVAVVNLCGLVTAFTPATASTTGSVTVNGQTAIIPVGYVAPSYVKVGASIILVFTAAGNKLVEISPGNCLSAAVPDAGSGGYRVGPQSWLFGY